jgi:hypothetical protein
MIIGLQAARADDHIEKSILIGVPFVNGALKLTERPSGVTGGDR